MAFDISNQEHQHKLHFNHRAEVEIDSSDILQYMTSAKLCCANFRMRRSPVVETSTVMGVM